WRQRGAGPGFSQPEPDYTGGWFAGSDVRFVFGGCLDLPLRGNLLRDDDRERRFVELNKRLAIGSCANEQFTGNLRNPFRPAPNCLALADGPPLLAQVGGGNRWQSAAATNACKRQKKDHLANRNKAPT